MNTQAQIGTSTARLHDIERLLIQDSLKVAPPAKLEAFLGEANELLALEPYSSAGHEVLGLVRAGVRVWEKAKALADENPHLASPYVNALLGETPALLLKELASFKPWFDKWILDVEHDVLVRMCLEAQGLYGPNHEPKGRDLDRTNSAAVTEVLAKFVTENVGAVVKAAYRAGTGRWPEHGYPNGYEVEAIRLFQTIKGMGVDGADTVEVSVRSGAPLLLGQLL